MKWLDFVRYSKKQLEDLSKYVSGTSCQTLLNVTERQKEREEQCRRQGRWWKQGERLIVK